MNNKLDEYRDREAASYDNCASSMAESMWMPMGYAAGFNAAIALNLPVKFAEWLSFNGIKTDYKDNTGKIHWYKMELASHTHKGTTEDLYKYWLDNIYKPE